MLQSAAVSKVHTVVVPSIANENDSDDQNDMDLNVITADILRLGTDTLARFFVCPRRVPWAQRVRARVCA